jgi:hypothetical protein
MDNATDRPPQPPRRSPALRDTHIRTHGAHSFRTTQIRFRNIRHRVKFQQAPAFLQVQATELRQAKTHLTRLYTQETEAAHAESLGGRTHLKGIRNSRGVAERRYVHGLIKYMRDANRMDRYHASYLQQMFTREKMADTGVSYQDYLLEMYPQELN